ncbi:VOC family protein [Pseudonocardia abyssalis]|uniref:VOC family protein n=1 Tax=Pseudonocardia abyssalis TaxID=2792008 RepID=A0ABS6UTU8_9PSEU|nr:VOC family protein [Pseudonocardia abyssalis]MBW0115329.1 VOC family protein [Pseudonocardia abyssalis]MBW0135657.1 VOC family protein [Pseudonocardia abyssalis]
MPTTTPCLWFDVGVAEQAAEFYVSVFPNSAVGAVTRHPDGGVLTVEFTLDGQPYVGLNGGDQFRFTEAVSLQIRCTGQEEVDHYWDALSDGGEEGPCGWLKDRFGLSWQVTPVELLALIADPDPARAARVLQAMYTMRRLDVAELLRAADAAPA